MFFLHWLLSVIGMVTVAFREQAENIWKMFGSEIGETTAQYVFLALMAVYAVLSIICLLMIFKRDGKRGDRGFITMDSSENGKVRIAVAAVEQMVRRAIEHVDGIAETKIAISNRDDALNVTVKAVLAGGAHVPTVTLNIQRAIRQYVEMNCGVAVCTVSVNVQSISSTVQAAEMPVMPQNPQTAAPEYPSPEPEKTAPELKIEEKAPDYEEPAPEYAEPAPEADAAEEEPKEQE